MINLKTLKALFFLLTKNSILKKNPAQIQVQNSNSNKEKTTIFPKKFRKPRRINITNGVCKTHKPLKLSKGYVKLEKKQPHKTHRSISKFPEISHYKKSQKFRFNKPRFSHQIRKNQQCGYSSKSKHKIKIKPKKT